LPYGQFDDAGKFMATHTATAPRNVRAALLTRLGVAGGLFALAMGGAAAVMDANLRHIRRDVEVVIKVAQPMAEAAFEMENETISAGMAVVKYLHVADPAQQQGFRYDREDFQRYLQRYRDLASDQQQLELAAKLELRFGSYAGIGEILLDAKDQGDRDIVAITHALRDVDRRLVAELGSRPLADPARQAVVAKAVDRLKLEMWRIPLQITNVSRADARAEREIADTILNIRAQFITLARAAPDWLATVRKLSDEFESIAPRIQALSQIQWQVADGLQRLVALRNEIGDLLNDEIQHLTSEDLAAANESVLKNVRSSRLVLFLALIALFGILAAILTYAAYGFVRPIKQLAAYAAEVGNGNFAAPVNVRSKSEVGHLARTLAEMADKLQSHDATMARESAERLKMKENLQRSERMAAIGELTGGIAHDFNNMLMVIGGYAERALKNLDQSDVVKKSIGEVMSSVGVAADLTQRLLVFSGRRAVESHVFEVARLRNDVDAFVQLSAGKTHAIEYDFRDAGARINSNPNELTQAVLNLVINATHASPPGSRIQITAELADIAADFIDAQPTLKPGRYVVISVIDEGGGIPESVLARIFEPFFTTKAKGTGTGLGLSMVYGFAEQSGGGVGVMTKLGKGSTFHIYLPVTERPAEVLEAKDLTVNRGRGESILLVDDDAKILDLMHEVLTDLGYTVHSAAGALDAVEIATAAGAHIDIMLSDIVMPAMTGVEAYGLINNALPGLPIVFMSGYPNRFTEVTIPDHAHFLQKPVKTPLLAQTLRTALAKGAPVFPEGRQLRIA
jgi:signal transduction histidine kinase/ActR/RegA family two-component response regulator